MTKRKVNLFTNQLFPHSNGQACRDNKFLAVMRLQLPFQVQLVVDKHAPNTT